MTERGQLDIIDVLSIMSFVIGLMNLDENISQGDLAEQTDRLLNEVHGHLEMQDIKIERILELLDDGR